MVRTFAEGLQDLAAAGVEQVKFARREDSALVAMLGWRDAGSRGSCSDGFTHVSQAVRPIVLPSASRWVPTADRSRFSVPQERNDEVRRCHDGTRNGHQPAESGRDPRGGRHAVAGGSTSRRSRLQGDM